MTLQRTPLTSVYTAPGTPATDERHHDPASALATDTATFWRVWEQYHQSLLARRCLRWMGGNRPAAEDALSDACLRAWQGWRDQPQPITNIPGWLSRLVHNHCCNVHIAQDRHARVVQAVDDIARVRAQAATAPASSPEQDLLCRELGDVIRQAIAHLPPRLQEPARLYFLEEVEYQAIAVRLQMPPATVRKRIQHARALLQPRLATYLAGEARADPLAHTQCSHRFPSSCQCNLKGVKIDYTCNRRWRSPDQG